MNNNPQIPTTNLNQLAHQSLPLAEVMSTQLHNHVSVARIFNIVIFFIIGDLTFMRLSFRFSTRKFYEIVQQQNIAIMPEIPEDAVLSKFLTLSEQGNQHPSNKLAKWEKHQPTALNYQQLLNGSPHGSVQSFIHRRQQITLISTNYFRINDQKLHRVLFAEKPDALIIQRRPEYHLHNFQMITKGPDNVFSDSEYLKAIQFSSQSIKPQQKSYQPIANAYNKTKDDALQPMPSKEILQEKGFDICTKYSASYQTPMFFAEMPMRAYRQWLANSHTLMELQEIFKVVCRRLPRYQNLSFNPYQMATLIYPDTFLKPNDIYMSTIIQMLISTKKYKKIVGIMGITQNQSVKHILQQNQALNPILQLLLAPAPKGTIIRDIHNLEIVQKHLLLDVMFFGQSVLDIKTQQFHTTNSIIQKYCQGVDRKIIMQFRYQKVMEYIGLLKQKVMEGQEEIKKQFVREALRSK